MKLIEITFYLEKLINTMNTPDIKVITVVRRVKIKKVLNRYGITISKTCRNIVLLEKNFQNLTFIEKCI